MGIWYIKELTNLDEMFNKDIPRILKKIIYKIKNIFNILTIKEIDNKTICLLPIMKSNQNAPSHVPGKTIKLANQIDIAMKDKEQQNVVISNYLNEIKEFKNELYSKNINILDGRWLFNYLVPNIIEYISEKQEKDVHMQEVSIMCNENSDTNINNIVLVAKKVKMLNIVTNNIEKFKKIEEYLYENLGIMVRITNNTKKAILKSHIIINLDFPEEIINKYSIPKNAVIVNIDEKIKIKSKRFSGINASYYRIFIPQKYINIFTDYGVYDNFDETILYESILYRKNSYESTMKEINENNSKITNLVGENGIISEYEYKSA